MRVLVTGGAGFIGSNIARALIARGDHVRILDNLLAGFEEAIPSEAEFVKGDVRELEDVRRACDGVDIVFHQAALRSVPKLRYFNVFGPGQHPESKYAALFPAFISKLVAGEPPEVHWDGEQSRDFTFVEDVVRANLCAAEAGDAASGQTFNMGGGVRRP